LNFVLNFVETGLPEINLIPLVFSEPVTCCQLACQSYTRSANHSASRTVCWSYTHEWIQSTGLPASLLEL